MEEKVLKMDCDEAIEYVKENVKIRDHLELAYNRIFTAGEVLNVDTSKYHGVHGVKVMIHIEGDTLTPSVEVDLVEFKDDLIEVRHVPQDGEGVLIIIERCEIEE